MPDAKAKLRRYLIETTRLKKRLGLVPEGYNYVGAEDYLLDRGSPFDSEPLTPEELQTVLDAIANTGIKRFMKGHCFYNAQMLAAMDPAKQLHYCEGYAVGTVPLPVLHGWVMIHDKVVDVTWRTGARRRRGGHPWVLGVLPPGWAYYGAVFDTGAVQARIVRMRATGSFLEDYANDFALFQEPRLRSLAELVGR